MGAATSWNATNPFCYSIPITPELEDAYKLTADKTCLNNYEFHVPFIDNECSDLISDYNKGSL